MIKSKFFLHVIFLIIGIAVLHQLAIYFYLYWTVWWMDNLAHFLGGVWVALAVLWFLYFSGFFFKQFKKKNFLLIGVVTGVIVGLLWEVFEFSAGITYLTVGYWTDTISDLIFDSLGALLGSFYVIYKNKE